MQGEGSATNRRIFPEGTYVHFENKLAVVTRRDDSLGSNVYRVRPLEEENEYTAFPWQLDYAEEEGRKLMEEFRQEFEAESDSSHSNCRKEKFSHVTDEEKKNFVDDNKNKNTVKKTNQHHRLLKKYLAFVGDTREVEVIPPNELNCILESFFVCVKKDNGDNYEPSTIRGMMGSIHRFLQEHNYEENIMSSAKFAGMRTIVSSKFKVIIPMSVSVSTAAIS